MSIIPDPQMHSAAFIHEPLENLRVSWGRNSILVIVFCVACFLLGHQIVQKKREADLVATFAERRAVKKTKTRRQSFSTFCSPCALLPHLVLELDKLSEELPFLLEWIGLSAQRGLWAFPQPAKRQCWVGERQNACTKPFWGTCQVSDW